MLKFIEVNQQNRTMLKGIILKADSEFVKRILETTPQKWQDFVNGVSNGTIYILESYLFQDIL